MNLELNSNGKAKEKTPQRGAFGKKGIVSAIDKSKLEELNQSSNLPAEARAKVGHSINQFHAVRSDMLSLIEASKLLQSGVEVVAERSRSTVVLSVSPKYFRPTEVACPFGKLLIGNPSKAKEVLGWEANTKFEDLVKLMTKSDFEKAKANNLQ